MSLSDHSAGVWKERNALILRVRQFQKISTCEDSVCYADTTTQRNNRRLEYWQLFELKLNTPSTKSRCVVNNAV